MKTKRAFSLVLALLTLLSLAYGQNADPDKIASWRSTLRFGVDSSVIGVIDEMESLENSELLPLLVELYPDSRIAVQTRIIDFAQKLESDVLKTPIAKELMFYQDIPGTTLIKMLNYLASYPVSDDPELELVYVEIAEGTNADQAAAAVRTMAKSGLYQDAQVLIDLFSGDRAAIAVQNAALVALADVGGELAKDFLVGIAEDQSEEGVLRQAAIASLGELGGNDLLPLFERLLQSEDPFTRSAALGAIGKAGYSGEAVDRLYLVALRDNFWRVRLAVLQTLELHKSEALFDILVYIARNDPEVPVRTQAYRTLTVWATPKSIDVLAEDMVNPKISEGYRLISIAFLAGKHFNRFKGELEKLIEEEWEKQNSRILDAVAKAMSTQNLASAAGIFERFLGHSNIIIKIYGVRGIGNSHLGQYRDRLEAFDTDGQNSALRRAAAQALGQL